MSGPLAVKSRKRRQKNLVIRAIGVALLLVLLGTPVAFAVSTQFSPSQPLELPEYKEPLATTTPGVGSLVLRITVALGVIVFLSYAVFRFISRQLKVSSSRWIKVVDQVAVGPNRGLFLVDVAGKLLALGITDHQITKLLEIDDPELIHQIREIATGLPEKPSMGIREWLQGKRLEQAGGKIEEEEYFAPRDFHRLVQKSLQRLRRLAREEEQRDDRR